MLRLFVAGVLLHVAAALFETCAPYNYDPIQKQVPDCPSDDRCDPSLIMTNGCVMTCSRGSIKFQDQTGKWTIALDTVIWQRGVFIKSAGGAATRMYRPTCVIDSSTPKPSTTTVGPKTSCNYYIIECAGCDSTKLYLDYNTTEDASLKCERGYTLLASTGQAPEEFKTASCLTPDNLWDAYHGLPSDTGPAPAEAFTCKKDVDTTPVTCPADAYNDLSWCVSCDKSKLRFVKTDPALETCRLQCDRGFKLVATTNRLTASTFYRDIAKSIWKKEWIGFLFTPSKTDPADRPLGNAPYVSCVADTNFVQVPPPPAPVVEPCGCPYSADLSADSNDYTKLFIQDSAGSGNGNCTIQCDTGYRLVRGNYPMSSATCKNGAWANIEADTTSFNPIQGIFSCQQVAGASCPQLSSVLGSCRPGMECNQGAVRPVLGKKSSCILSCGKGYRLWDATVQRLMAEVYYENGGWKGKTLGDVMGTLSYKAGQSVSVNCERYFSPSEQARLPPAGALTECGCAYRASLCPTCDWKQLFVLDGFGASSGMCTLGCGKGYVLEGANVNLISCKQNTWMGSSRTSMTAVPIARPQAWLTTSCVPTTDVGTCALAYNTLDCDGCDKSKIIVLPSKKGKSRCVLACDKGYRLVYTDPLRRVVRAQEAVLQQTGWEVYALGEVGSTAEIPSSLAKFSCEPAAPIAAFPATTGPPCGCPYLFKSSCSDCDNSKLIGRHDGAGTCSMSCAPGYQMESDNLVDNGVLTAANCYFYRWFGRTASLSNTFQSSSAPSFSCVRTATAQCLSSYSPLSACTICDSSKLRALSSRNNCQLGCATGFRLVAHSANSLTGAVRYAELTSSAGAWSGVTFENTLATLPTLFVGCEPETTTKPLAKCGCPYSNAGPEYGKLVPRTVWPDGNNCELMCEPGYRLKQSYWTPTGTVSYDFSLVVCQAGKWTARDYTGANTISLGANPALGCVKAETDYISPCSAPTWLPLQCAGCSTEALLPVASGYTCQFTCRAGWRLLAQHRAATSPSRPRIVALKGNEWIGTGGQGLLTTLYYGVQPLISCEPDTYPPAVDPAPVPRPPIKPCEYCKQPIAQATCPVGKSCVAEFLPLWQTAANCMQVRCQNARTMLINKSNAWISTDGLNCEADGTWKTTTGVAFPADVAITCDANTGGNATLIEVVYNIYRKGISLIALDPNYKSPIGG